MKKPTLPTFNGYLLCILIFLVLILLNNGSYSKAHDLFINYTTKLTKISKFEDNKEETNTKNDCYEEISKEIITNLTAVK